MKHIEAKCIVSGLFKYPSPNWRFSFNVPAEDQKVIKGPCYFWNLVLFLFMKIPQALQSTLGNDKNILVD